MISAMLYPEAVATSSALTPALLAASATAATPAGELPKINSAAATAPAISTLGSFNTFCHCCCGVNTVGVPAPSNIGVPSGLVPAEPPKRPTPVPTASSNPAPSNPVLVPNKSASGSSDTTVSPTPTSPTTTPPPPPPEALTPPPVC